ncbi:MAG TPA: kelch repeat-containing protein [Polyangiaceae bacterium]|jgi:N-acetylneuraminic acid mutarotase
MQESSRAFLFAVSSLLLAGAAGCGSRSSLETTTTGERMGIRDGDAAAQGNEAGDGAVLQNDHDAGGGPDCALDPLSCEPHIVLFGGFSFSSNTFLGDTWEWDGSTWTQRNASGPSPRAGHAMATLDGKVVLFGGSMTSSLPADTMLEGGTFGDTWEWDGSAWTERATGPSPGMRSRHAMATLNGKVVLFGGGVDGQTLAPPQTWLWDGDTWSLGSSRGPSARRGHTMTTVGDRVVLFGGADENGTLFDDVWTWDGTAWTPVVTYGSAGYLPPARYGHAAAALGGALWISGGVGSVLLGDLWSWNFSLWSLETSGPSLRDAASMATLGDSVFLFGGDLVDHLSDDSTYRWDGTAWSHFDQAGPPARAESAMATQ